MTTDPTSLLLEKLDALRVELLELSCTLDRCGSHEAADVAVTTSARVAELCEECSPLESKP
ncbi:MAG: hypothetical protein WC205_04615 [Opitutaceae bacterium]|jgi:hypothetical protein